jgi:hypothetical protein
MAWHGKPLAWHGMAWHGMAWHGMAASGYCYSPLHSAGSEAFILAAFTIWSFYISYKECIPCLPTWEELCDEDGVVLRVERLYEGDYLERYRWRIGAGTVQCSAVQCSAVQCSAVQCSAVQCSAAK